MPSIQDIQPEAAALAPQAAPVAPEQAAAPAGPDINALPPEVASLPAVQAVSIGQPAAVSASAEDKDNPAVALIAKSARDLPAAGLALYGDDKVAVLFNPTMISPQEIAQAVKDGSLDKLAIPIGVLDKAVADVMAEDAATGGGGGGSPVPPAAAGTKRQINSARVRNLKPQAPSSGAKAGQGIVNDLTRPVI